MLRFPKYQRDCLSTANSKVAYGSSLSARKKSCFQEQVSFFSHFSSGMCMMREGTTRKTY